VKKQLLKKKPKPNKHKKEAHQGWKLGQVTCENIETLSDDVGIGLGKTKPTWEGCERQQKKASTGLSTAKGRLGKMWTHC